MKRSVANWVSLERAAHFAKGASSPKVKFLQREQKQLLKMAMLQKKMIKPKRAQLIKKQKIKNLLKKNPLKRNN